MATLDATLLRDLADHAIARADRTGDCWVHPGSKNADGYAELRTARLSDIPGHSRYAGQAHRIVYEYLRGPIPEGLTINHDCLNRACVNPDHMTPMTLAANIREALDRKQAEVVSRGTCANGHPYSEANTYIHKGIRYCRRCNVIAARKTREKATA